jgi:hypothetical protein
MAGSECGSASGTGSHPGSYGSGRTLYPNQRSFGHPFAGYVHAYSQCHTGPEQFTYTTPQPYPYG